MDVKQVPGKGESINRRPNIHGLKVIAAFAAIYFIWGTTYLAMRVAVETIPPFLMAGTRFLLAGFLTMAVMRWKRVPWPPLNQWISAAIVGLFLMVGGNGLVTWAEQEIPSGIAALVVATMPLWMVLFNWWWFDKAKPSGRVAAGLILGFGGVFLLIGPDQILGQGSLDLVSLVVLMFAPVFWSLGSLVSRRVSLPQNAFMATAMQTICGGMVLMLISASAGEFNQFSPAQVSIASWISWIYLAIFGSIIALSSYVWLLKHSKPSRVATYTYVNPIIAVILGWAILSEPIGWLTAIAMTVIVLGVLLITVQPRTSKAPVERAKATRSPEPVTTEPSITTKA